MAGRIIMRTGEALVEADEAWSAAAELESAEEIAGCGVERSILAAEAAVQPGLACVPVPGVNSPGLARQGVRRTKVYVVQKRFGVEHEA